MELASGKVLAGEIHEESDQYFIVTEGSGHIQTKASDPQFIRLEPGVIVQIDAGMWHEVTCITAMKLVVIYAKPNHPEGTAHLTDPEER